MSSDAIESFQWKSHAKQIMEETESARKNFINKDNMKVAGLRSSNDDAPIPSSSKFTWPTPLGQPLYLILCLI